MKSETLLESLNYLDEDLLAESERPLQVYRKKPLGWLAAAAAIVLVVGLGFAGWTLLRVLGPASVQAPQANSGQTETLDPSMLPTEGGAAPNTAYDIPDLLMLEAGGVTLPTMNEEALKARLADKLWPGYPVFRERDDAEDLLPVYEAKAGAGSSGQTVSLEFAGERAAVLFHLLSTPSDEITLNEADGTATVWNDTGWTLIVNTQGRATLMFAANRPKPPSGCYTDSKALAANYLTQYSALFQLSIDYDSPNERRDAYLNQTLLQVEMALGEDGSLHSLSFDACFGSRYSKLEEYRIISYEAAYNLAKDGRCYCAADVSEFAQQLREREPDYVELSYLPNGSGTRLLPYYIFWMPLASEPTCYMPLFVPAVDANFISDLPEPIPPTEAAEDAARELPILSAANGFHESAMVGSLEALDELPAHPWTEDTGFQTLPVFEARQPDRAAYDPILDQQTMEEYLHTLAEQLGFGEIEISPAVYNLPEGAQLPEDAFDLVAQAGDQCIFISDFGRVLVQFGQTQKDAFRALPEETKAQLQTDPRFAKEYYVSQFRAVLELPYKQSWELEIDSTQAAIDPRYQSGRATDDPKELYLADMLRNVNLAQDRDGCIRILGFDLCFRERWLPVGDYPILSLDAAKALARNHQYYTDGLLWGEWEEWKDYEFVWKDQTLLHGELIYNQITPQTVLIPYYRFFVAVEIVPASADQQKQTVYVPIYVPAVRSDYLNDFPPLSK